MIVVIAVDEEIFYRLQ